MNNQLSIHSFSMGAFVWWTGVVEDRFDPEELGRLKIRMVGYHSEDKSLIPTDALHWAYPSQSITSAAMSGLGHSPTGIVEGTHCWGFFRDGHDAQDPIIVGTWGGIPTTGAKSSVGFHDPSGKYPKSTHIGEPDTNRLARGKTNDTVIATKQAAVDVGVPIAFGGVWNEPPSPYGAEYPYNHVHESESGHVIEVDDTPGAERLHTYHMSGTSEEIHPDGTMVTKVVKDNYEVVMGDDYLHVFGGCNITVMGDSKINTLGNSFVQTAGNHMENVGGNYTLNIGGLTTIISGGPMVLQAPIISLN